MLSLLAAASARAGQGAAPKILLDQPLRAVEYQLGRLTPDELTRVERKEGDPRYRPVYVALLTREGVARSFRVEAAAALGRMDKVGEAQVLLDALARVKVEDVQAADQLIGMLAGQPVESLRAHREALVKASENREAPLVQRGAYGALMVADGSPAKAWQMAVAREGDLLELLRSVALLGSAEPLRAQLFAPIAALIASGGDAATRRAAITALGWTRRDLATFQLLSQEVLKGTDPEARAAAVGSLWLIPDSVWPKAEIEPLARSLVAFVGETSPDRRTEPAMLEAVQFAERLAGALPVETGRAVRRDLRALGVRVVRIESVFEQVRFDLNWFAVEAGKPVQIVLSNVEAMPHNLLIGTPGSLQEIGMAGGAMPPPTDPAVKAFVPDLPSVLFSTRLLQQGETETLGFTAPREPGQYVFLCTFPGHWVRMYGVMLVVANLDAWEANPTPPNDPTTGKPFAAQRQ